MPRRATHPKPPGHQSTRQRALPHLSGLTLAVLTLCQGLAQAQTAPAAEPGEAKALERVEITGTPLTGPRLRRDQVAAPVQNATAEDIERSGALHLGDFLQRLGSVHLNEMQGNPFQPDVNYRGFTASPLLGTPQGLSVYVDGVRQNQPFGDTVSWDLIPRSAIASMTLMPGSNPLFGLNTLGGALSVTTKDGRTSPGTSVQFSLGSNARRQVEFETGGSSDDGFDWYGTGTYFQENGWRDASPSKVGQLFGKLGWHDGRTRISLSLATSEASLTGNGLQDQQLLASDWRSVYTKPDETHNRSSGATLQFSHQLNQAVSFSGNAYARAMSTNTLNGDINEGSLDQSVYALSAADKAALTAAGIAFPSAALNAANTPFPYLRCIAQALQGDEPGEKCNGLLNTGHSAQHHYGVTGQMTWRAPLAGMNNQFILGGGWDGSWVGYNQLTQLGYINADRSVTGVNAYADGVTGGNVDGVPYDNRVSMESRSRTASLFLTDTLSITPNLHLTFSGRYNRTRLTNSDLLNPGGGAESLDGDHTFSRFNPAIGLAWSLNPALNMYAGYSEGSRAPTAIELGCANPDRPCKLPNAMAGDPPLNQVVTRTMELGLRGRLDRNTAWNIGVFRADNKQDILFVADDQAGYGYFKNFGETRRQGLELGAATRVGAWRMSANYTWLDATFRSDELVNGSGNSTNDGGAGLEGNIQIHSGDRMPLIPQHQLKLSAEWQVSKAVEIEFSGIGISGSYARGNENNAHQPDGQYYLGSGKTGGYAVFNLGANWQPTRGLKVFGQINNLFDRQYATAGQLGAAAFTSSGSFQARPLGGSSAAGYPLQNTTFYAPGAPRSLSVGLRYLFDML